MFIIDYWMAIFVPDADNLDASRRIMLMAGDTRQYDRR